MSQCFFAKTMQSELKKVGLSFSLEMIQNAIFQGQKELEFYKTSILKKGKETLDYIAQSGKDAIVLAGRPYHIDKFINHGIDKYITSLGFVVLSEDCLPLLDVKTKSLNQWTYHARLYSAAKFVSKFNNIELVQLVSFGCGIDAITSDEIRDLLKENGKIYTQLKIDEVTNLGAVKIRLRSLKETMQTLKNQKAKEINVG